MTRQKLCNYGNCENTDCDLVLSNPKGGTRSYFCCLEHAGLYALRQAWMTGAERPRDFVEYTQAAAHKFPN